MYKLLFLFVAILILSGCGIQNEETQVREFSLEATTKLKTAATIYPDRAYQDGEVPLNEWIQMTGKITDTDSQSEEIRKGDRFVLQTDSAKYQIFNQQETTLYLNDEVTVYGEYYGFIKGTLIERNTGR
ncbi:hypothetical protein A5886_000493 [Enterococcus sp. 8G7_MSG3316]|uniref:Lipoprotein n=1 Tax=Candidatus Enterococcus testudinis TaxID=1834191 RepID=A0A242A490_9ENTE|nr:hypothetical protein [Enterococcus sp. 8G7_MSG3316]OTN75423.1 hypothetical protein A5886_000493 [Enterococcus sp. 8G7_MSG3316]